MMREYSLVRINPHVERLDCLVYKHVGSKPIAWLHVYLDSKRLSPAKISSFVVSVGDGYSSSFGFCELERLLGLFDSPHWRDAVRRGSQVCDSLSIF